jgi:hypothetical protein
MRKQNQLNGLIARTVGSKTLHNWCADPGSIKLRQLMNLSQVMQLPLCEIINSITTKNEGDE